MASHATSIIKLHIGPYKKEGRKPSTFSLNSGINFPLFFVASKRRDGAIRRKQIKLLRALDRQEGVYNSLLMALLLDRLVSI
jgi:hypothetical protein